MVKPDWLDRFLIQLMSMPVHPLVYLCVIISVWHSAITVFNGVALSGDDSLIFLDTEAFNIIIGNLGIVVGLLLVGSLRYSKWAISLVFAYIAMFAWTVTAAMLFWNHSWGGGIMSIFYVLVYFYIAIACSLHKAYGYPGTKSIRQEFYERQK